ncbi:cingulin-like isoform X2 [Arapaima gigas]
MSDVGVTAQKQHFRMSLLPGDRKPPIDCGVQIRFIKDLHETGGALQGTKSKSGISSPSSKYGVAVRVQGVSGQPYVVLKEGEKGDSYGVQLKAQSLTYRSKPLEKGEEQPPNPYLLSEGGQFLRRGRSHDSLLENKVGETPGGQFSRPQRDERSLSSGNLTETREEVQRNGMGGPSPGAQNGAEEEEEDNFLSMDCFPEPPPPVEYLEDPTPAIDTNSLSPVDKLISRFDGGKRSYPTRGSSGSQLRSDNRKPHSTLVAGGNEPKTSTPHSFFSPGPIPYGSLPSSSASSTSSLEQTSGLVAKAKTVSSPKPSSWSANRRPIKQVQPVAKEIQVTPDLLRDQGQSAEIMSEEEKRKQFIYNILKEGTSESDSSLKQKVNLVFEEIQKLGSQKDGSHEALKAELEDCLDENMQLQEQLDRKKAELHETHNELTQLRMDREAAEAQVRVLEDQRADLQDELRRVCQGSSEVHSLQTDLMSVQAELAEVSMLRQRQEETLRQRDRELTALKGVLKDEVATHDQEMEGLREKYSKDVEKLRSTMEEVLQSQQSIEMERQRVNSSVLSLQQQLETCRNEGDHWRANYDATKDELLSTKQELLKALVEKDEFEEELKKLQEKLTAMKRQLPETRLDLERKLERQQKELDRKIAELDSLKQREAEQKLEMNSLKEQLQREKKEMAKALEKMKQASKQQDLGAVDVDGERLRDGLASSERELQANRDQLSTTQKELLVQRETCQSLEEANTRLRERLGRLEMQLQSSVSLSSEAEQALEEQNRNLRAQLEEAKRTAARVGQEREELVRRLEERDRERESLRRGRTDLEEQKRLLDRAMEKLNKEVGQMSQESRQAVLTVQAQLDEHKERSRRDLLEAQRQAKDRLAELQRAQASVKSLQEEVSRLKKDLLACNEEKDGALLDKQLLSNRLKHLEEELDAEKASLSERGRDLRGLEDKVRSLEMELDEERNNTELLNERISRSRDQVDQLRSELMQERSSKQDLELDKSALERQLKDMKSQVEELRDQPRPSSGTSQLESKLQEMEERLLSEEKEKSSLQAAQRRLERKLKELNITLDEERHRLSEQRDQVTLRVKALKRQLDESEGEVERLEGLRRKAMRDTEEQLEQQEILRARVTALEAELRRKAQQLRRPALDSSTLSSDEEEGP